MTSLYDIPEAPRIVLDLRVSDEGGRAERLQSIKVQRKAAKQWAASHGGTLVAEVDETDVSGTLMPHDRPIAKAIELIRSNRADVLLAASGDRLWRGPYVRDAIIAPIEAEGGQVWGIADGRQTNLDPQSEAMGTIQAAFGRQRVRESAAAVVRAHNLLLDEKRSPGARVPVGYRNEDRRYVVDPVMAPVVRDVFAMRAGGATVRDVQRYLAEHGADLSVPGVRSLLRNRSYVGTRVWGERVEHNAHEAIIDRDLFDRVQVVRSPTGRVPQQERLLSRLRILLCSGCGRPMVLGSTRDAQRVLRTSYRCDDAGRAIGEKCRRRVTISAPSVEAAILDYVSKATRDRSFAEGAGEDAQDARDAYKRAEDAYQHALEVLPLDEPGTQRRMDRLAAARDTARTALAEAEQRAERVGAVSVDLGRDLADLTVVEQRAVIVAVLASVTVGPAARGVPLAERLSFQRREAFAA